MGYDAKVICDSLSPSGVRLTTLEVTIPRIVLAEFNTHRMLSRNSASSRAIPVEKRIASVRAAPFVPEQFGRNQKGMQAGEALTGDADDAARLEWLAASRSACDYAESLAHIGVHKQLANRLIEPFCWQTIVVTATEWSNFFALRCHPDAQPEIRRGAEMMRDAMAASRPRFVGMGDWHLPYVDEPIARDEGTLARWAKVSIGRCARVSTLTHDGKRDPEADIALAERLRLSGHMSPFEHVATATFGSGDNIRFFGNFRGWKQYRKMLPNEHDFSLVRR